MTRPCKSEFLTRRCAILVLSRQVNEDLVIQFDGRELVVRVVRIRDGKVRIGIEAPPDVKVWRRELLERMTLANLDQDFSAVISAAPDARTI